MTGHGQGRGRGGGGSRGDRGGGSWRGDQRGSSSRGGRGEGSSRGDRGNRGDRGFGRGSGRGGGRGGSSHQLEAYGTDNPLPPPDAEVAATEESIQRSLGVPPDGQLIDLSELSLTGRPAKRPGYGTKGTPVTVWANHFRITSINTDTLWRYHIQITPQPSYRKIARVIQLLLSEGHVSRLSPALASDFKMLLFAREELTEDDISEEIRYKDEEEDTPSERAKTYTIKLQHTGTLDLAALKEYVQSTDARSDFQALGECIQALNIIIGHHAKSQSNSTTLSIGSNRHFAMTGEAAESFDLGGGLVALRGYFTSVRNGASRMTLNVQVKHTPVYEAIPLPLLIDKFKDLHGASNSRLEKFLNRVRVRTDHLPERKNSKGRVIPRIMTIAGLATKYDGRELGNPPKVSKNGAGPTEVEFFLADSPSGPESSSASSSKGNRTVAGPQAGRYLTISKYFQMRYNRKVDNRYPVINVGSRGNPSYMPVDVCHVIPGQLMRRQLHLEQIRNMLNCAVRNANLNAISIRFCGTVVIGINPHNPTVASFEIFLSELLSTAKGRIVVGPQALYKDNKIAQTRFGSWNMDQIQFSSGARLSTWSFVVITKGRPIDPMDPIISEPMREFYRELNRNGIHADIPVGSPGFALDLGSGDTIEDGFRNASNARKRVELLLFILPSYDVKLYNTIKYLGDIKYGIHTVCALFKNITRKKGDKFDLQYFSNVSLKFNLKLGGTNQHLDPAKLGLVGEGKTMLVGVDVTHPSQHSSKNAKSVSGMVASIDSTCVQFPAILKMQEAREEIVSELKDMLKSRLRVWQKHNQNAFPENILVYRDGISEGQFSRVIEVEVPSLKEACQEIYPSTTTQRRLPRLTVVVCGKRHSTRFYPSSTEPGKIDVRSGNNPNGTVVDKGITDPRLWDFYLQAHTAIHGTARPAHYYVIHDEIFSTRKLSQQDRVEGYCNAHDVVENLTHNISYLYGRATKAVSIVPPAYYADLLCERARCYMSDFFDPDSETEPSSAAASSSGGEPMPSSDRVLIHENLRDTMFYI